MGTVQLCTDLAGMNGNPLGATESTLRILFSHELFFSAGDLTKCEVGRQGGNSSFKGLLFVAVLDTLCEHTVG